MNHVPARRTSRPGGRIHARLIVAAVWTAATVAAAQVPPPPMPLGPPPQPTENPITESKRVLGKILFWDEQLSSDDTVACGSCHDPIHGGGDARLGVNPGPDGTAPTPDDVIGSPGVARTNEQGRPVEDPVFGLAVQVTPRSANAVIGAADPPELYWDGRASTTFVDPQTGGQSIAIGGALESQAVAPILNDVEMARSGRTWDEVIGKLERSLPLTDATDLPDDVAAALDAAPGYPELFDAAFGDPAITAERIAFAVATDERTLVPDQTPWDAFIAGDLGAMTPGQVQGWDFFRTSPCSGCHRPPTRRGPGAAGCDRPGPGARPVQGADLAQRRAQGDPHAHRRAADRHRRRAVVPAEQPGPRRRQSRSGAAGRRPARRAARARRLPVQRADRSARGGGELPLRPGHGFFYLKGVVDGTGAERGLGATSTGTPRTVLVGCAGTGTSSISQN